MGKGDIMELYTEFYSAFEKLEQEKCIKLAHDALKNGVIDVKDLYESILRKSLANLTDIETDINHKIWKEHIQSGIVRTIIEQANPYVLSKRSTESLLKAAVICPDGEQHELGARMVSDYIRMLGYETFFVGRDTPRNELHDLINTLKVDVIAISVTNYYNLSKALQMVQDIKNNFPNIKLIVGGRGLDVNAESFVELGVDVTHSYDDIQTVLRPNL
jgi:methanogenic corrinoid protein MtbC1